MRRHGTCARFLRMHLTHGLRSIWPRLTLVACMAAMAFVLSYAVVVIKAPATKGALTLGESLLCMWRGMLPFVADHGEQFQFPMAWFALLAAMAYAVLDYPVRDLACMGTRLIVAGQSRWSWWWAMAAWLVAMAGLCWLITVSVAIAATAFTGGAWTWKVRPVVALVLSAGRNNATYEANQLFDGSTGTFASTGEPMFDIVPFMLAALVALAALFVLQMVVSFALHPVVGLAGTMAVLFFSAYFTQRWLLGNYLMAARTQEFMRAGMDPAQGALLAVGIAVVALLVGGWAFCRRDIVGREGSAP